MSALGGKRTRPFAGVRFCGRYGGKADMAFCGANICCSKADIGHLAQPQR